MILETIVKWEPLEIGGEHTYTTFRERVSDNLSYEELLEIVREFIIFLRGKYQGVIGAESVRII